MGKSGKQDTGKAGAGDPATGSTGKDEGMADKAKREKCDQRFVKALREVLTETRPLSREEMAAMFDEDGGLGSEMRHMLLESGDKKS